MKKSDQNIFFDFFQNIYLQFFIFYFKFNFIIFLGWKLPDKLRIIKPLEGSLTLHQWQRLAKPSLEGIFEERKGVVMRGSRANNLTITEEDQISGKFF